MEPTGKPGRITIDLTDDENANWRDIERARIREGRPAPGPSRNFLLTPVTPDAAPRKKKKKKGLNMLKLDLDTKKFDRLGNKSLAEAGLTERYHLQEYIANSPEAFFDEIGEDLFIVGKEVPVRHRVKDKIDLLAFDRDGNAVIIELKRGNNKWQLSQSLSYAAMVSKWRTDESWETVGSTRQEELKKFLRVEPEYLNRSQRIILIAEDYDYEVLITSEWIADTKQACDITCIQIALSEDTGGSRYMSCTQLFPVESLEDLAIQRGMQRSVAVAGQKSWKDLIDSCDNEAERQFFHDRIKSGQRTNANKDSLAYPQTGTIRWYVEIRTKRAFVYQVGRFTGDESFWKQRVSDPDLGSRKGGTCLRFFLTTEADFAAFQKAMDEEAVALSWTTAEMTTEAPLTAAAG